MPTQESVSRRRTGLSAQESASRADELLRASISRGRPNSTTTTLSVSTYTSSAASVSRSRTAVGDANALADQMLRQSLSSPRSRPPSYRSVPDSMDLYKAPTSAFKPSPSSGLRSSVSRGSADSVMKASPASRKKRMQEELNHARARVSRPDSKEAFKKLCSTDLLFLIDTTGSMYPYIASVKDQVRSIVDDIKKTFFGDSDVRIAIVGYKDHESSPNVQFLDFTSSVSEVYSFLNSLSAGGGADIPEDVLGGLSKALNASWQQETRCLVHIADAPAHGNTLHDLDQYNDSYYTPGSEPHRLTYEPILTRLTQLHINYAFLQILDYTDRMTFSFAKIYGPGNGKLLPSNKYAYELGSRGASSGPNSFGTASAKPQFEELALGTTYSAIRHLVLKTVTSSLSRTVSRFTMTRSNLGRTSTLGALGAIREDSAGADDSRDIALEKVPPQWDDAGWFDETFDMEGFLPAGTHHATTLQQMMDSDDNISLSTADVIIRARSKLFGKGAMRTASYAQTDASDNRFVIKSFIKDTSGRPAAIEDMKIQALCKAFALEFNGLLQIDPPLDFVVTSCLEPKTKSGAGAAGGCRSLEPYIEGTYVKYNNNAGWVNEDTTDEFNQMAQAFSHFTFERSWGHMLVNDLQGVDHLLTDPAIQTKHDDRFPLSDANMGEAGIKYFFIYHECNKFCTKLGLKSNKEMFMSGEFVFREMWPAMEPTVCCSNKFCRSIVRLAKAQSSEKYPGHQWCEKCFPQLESYTVQNLCEGPGDNHDFEVSRFFHESQGEAVPRECPEHRRPDMASSSAAAVGGKMFNRRLSKKGSSASISGKMW